MRVFPTTVFTVAITAALCHPLEAASLLLVQTMIDVIEQESLGAPLQRTIPFEIITPENI